jgi:hypothetical protein
MHPPNILHSCFSGSSFLSFFLSFFLSCTDAFSGYSSGNKGPSFLPFPLSPPKSTIEGDGAKQALQLISQERALGQYYYRIYLRTEQNSPLHHSLLSDHKSDA